MSMRWILFLCACASGCGGNNTQVDAGRDAGSHVFPDLPGVTTFMAVETAGETTFVPGTLDYTCAGSATEPAGGASIAATLRVLEFRDHTPYSGSETMQVWFFADDLIRETCDPPDCQLLTLNPDTGEAAIMVPTGGWYAYWVRPIDGPTGGTTAFSLLQTNELAPSTAGQTVDGRWVSRTTADVITAAGGFSRQDGTVLLAGAIQDCSSDESRVSGVVVRVFNPDGSEVLPSQDISQPQFRYFQQSGTSSTPFVDLEWTEENGLYLVAQLPVPEGNYRVEAWGRRTAGGEIERLGCEEAHAVPDGISVVNIGPLRSDRPASCQ